MNTVGISDVKQLGLQWHSTYPIGIDKISKK